MRKRKTYTSQFKREAVRLMESSEKPSSDVARQLGVRRNQLYKREPAGSGLSIELFDNQAHREEKPATVG